MSSIYNDSENSANIWWPLSALYFPQKNHSDFIYHFTKFFSLRNFLEGMYYLNISDEKLWVLLQSPGKPTRNTPLDNYFPLTSIFSICQLAGSLLSNQNQSVLHLYNYC